MCASRWQNSAQDRQQPCLSKLSLQVISVPALFFRKQQKLRIQLLQQESWKLDLQSLAVLLTVDSTGRLYGKRCFFFSVSLKTTSVCFVFCLIGGFYSKWNRPSQDRLVSFGVTGIKNSRPWCAHSLLPGRTPYWQSPVRVGHWVSSLEKETAPLVRSEAALSLPGTRRVVRAGQLLQHAPRPPSACPRAAAAPR